MPRSKKQFKDMVDARCERILRTSLSVFAIKGFDAVKMEDISKAANCSRALIYHYFPTKSDLFTSLMPHVAHNMYEITEAIDYNQKAKDSLKQLLALLIAKLREDKKWAEAVHLVLNLHLQGEDMPRAKVRSKDRPFARKNLFHIISALIERGQKENDFYEGDVRQYTIAILAMLNSLAYNRIFLDEKFTPPGEEIIMNLVLKKGADNER